MSKANVLTHKSEKKAITKKLKAVKAEASALQRRGLLAAAAAAPSRMDTAEAPAFAGFNLPLPARPGADNTNVLMS